MKNKKVIVNKWDIVLIDWIDAVSQHGWKLTDGLAIPPYKVVTVGMFVGEDDIYWTVCTNDGWSSNQVSDTMSIPKGMITHVEIIKRAV